MNDTTASPDRTAVIEDRRFFGHPIGLGLLFVVEMWERFSYYGMRAILVPFLVTVLGWSTARASGELYATYTMLVYLTPLVGGYLADRFMGTRHALVVGGAVIAAGHFCLALPGMGPFYVGLGLIIAGTGLFKPNASTMVGQMYRPGDARRDKGFTIFYMGVNLGATIGQLVVGYLADRVSWHLAFAAAGVGMVIGLVIYVALRDRYMPGIGYRTRPTPPAAATPGSAPEHVPGMLPKAVGGALAGALLAFCLGSFTFSPIGLAFGVITGAALSVTVLGTRGEERRRVLALLIVVFFVAFFWFAFEQAGSSMNLFAFRNTRLMVLGFRVPPAWFQSVNTVAILLLAPVMAWLWGFLAQRGLEPSTPLKMVLGIYLVGIGFLFMAAGGHFADGGVQVSMFWLISAYLLHTVGELCLSPVGLSYVTKIAPIRFAALLMGVWYLSNAAANFMSGVVAGFMPAPGEARAAATGFGAVIQRFSTTQQGFFSIFVVTSFLAATALLLLVPQLKRMTASVKA